MNAVPVLDFEKDFAEVIGDPSARYMQDFHFFSSAGTYVGEAPEEHKRGALKRPLSEKARKAQALIDAARSRLSADEDESEALNEANRSIEAQLGARQRVEPDVLVDASKENAAALRAEFEAE